ncbi:MAG: hypothetical protein ABIL20_04480 [candidate division WOR-3 bacterium]
MNWVIYIFLLTAFLSCAPEPVPSGDDTTPIDLLNDPEMEIVENPETLMVRINDIDFTIKLKALYKVSGIVLSKKRYSDGWQGKMAPYDVALVWGELLRDSLYKKIKWWQEARWYRWRPDNGFPKDNYFIARYSSNNHVILASKNIEVLLGRIKKNDTIELSGYLVDINGSKNGNKYWWYSSMSRNDTGAGSCEVIYLTRIRLSGKVYE